MELNDVARFQSTKSPRVVVDRGDNPSIVELYIATSRSGSEYGNGLSKTPFTALKMAVFAPTPRPSVSTAIAANAGLRRSIRLA